ncbi:MAM and LDL-receptor class A domain-containing protein 1-like [Ruditapes philippinarum]|uniref:MAM and LDL-receptor class A domain-containing protein 1-like n=1 Tax=Ruditapes philippinarum TaxID=129788 RepID=UPI00295BCB34|nr:MAM and LDL-receptor class A domain-containing protein 1-like [Ruditapes philippinarum]
MAGYLKWITFCYLFSGLSVKALSSHECNFYESYCDWENENDSWELINATNTDLERKLPSARPDSDGFYIALKNQTKSAKFSSPDISSGRACIGLWYSVSKTDDYTIIVYISSKSRQIKRLQNTGVYKWMHIYININPTTLYKVEIEGIVKGNNGYVAVDDVRITTGATCPADCNFDNGLCAWEQVNGANKWQRRHGGPKLGPLNDHTDGDGFYILHSTNGTKAQISVAQDGVGDICLTLWYYMHGDNTINIYIKTHAETERRVNIIRGGQSDKWTKSQTQFFQEHGYEMIVEGVIRDDNTGDIAIDDISVKQGVCTKDESPILVYVLVSLVIVVIIVIGVVAFILWRKAQTKKKTPQETICHSGQSFSNQTYIGHNSELNSEQKPVSSDSDYAVIADGNIHLHTDKAEYNVLNARSKDKQERDFGYDRLKPSTAPFVDKSYSHVTQNNEENVNQNCRKESMENNKKTEPAEPKFPFEIEDDLDIDYDHAQSGTSDPMKPDNYSHLINAVGTNPDVHERIDYPHTAIGQNKSQIAENKYDVEERNGDNHHDYFILKKD